MNGLAITAGSSPILLARIGKKLPINLLAGIEVDILNDGTLDYSDEVLSQFDLVVAAIHGNMNQTPEVIHKRLDKALSNPYVNILAHPTGRLLGRPGIFFSERQPYLSENLIIELCKKHNVALEINCFPERLDLNLTGIKLAVENDVKLALGTDSHSCAHMSNMIYGAYLVDIANIP